MARVVHMEQNLNLQETYKALTGKLRFVWCAYFGEIWQPL